MKNFEQPYEVWLEIVTEKVQWADAQIGRLQNELDAMKQMRDAWACASFPGGLKTRGIKTHWVAGDPAGSVKNTGVISGTIGAGSTPNNTGAGTEYNWGAGMEDCGK